MKRTKLILVSVWDSVKSASAFVQATVTPEGKTVVAESIIHSLLDTAGFEAGEGYHLS